MPPPEHASIAVLPEIRETQRVSAAPEPVEYPSSDGKPMAESGWHAQAMIRAHEALDRHFWGREDLYLGIDLLVYYVEGDNTKSVVPGVFVAFGVGSQQRHTYKTWEEGKAPDFVLDFASASTSARDARAKKSLYAQIGVREYWRLDPVGNIMREPLFRLRHKLRTAVTADFNFGDLVFHGVGVSGAPFMSVCWPCYTHLHCCDRSIVLPLIQYQLHSFDEQAMNLLVHGTL